MIRVGDYRRFSALDRGTVASFMLDAARTVRLTVRAPHRTVLNLLALNEDGTFPEDVEPVFLAVVDGLTDVEFYVTGPYGIEAEADRVWLFSRDGEAIHAVVPDAQTFTRIAERRARDPNVERMEQLLFQSNELRMGAAIREMERENERRLREFEAKHSGAGAPGVDRQEPEPAPRAGEPARDAAPARVGTEGGTGDA